MNTCRFRFTRTALYRVELYQRKPKRSPIAAGHSAARPPNILPSADVWVLFCRGLAFGHSAAANYSLGIASLPRLIRLSAWLDPHSLLLALG